MKTIVCFLIGLAFIIGGCSTTSTLPKKDEKQYIRFPKAVDIQYLATFGSQQDLTPPSEFRKWVVGKDVTDENKKIAKPYGIATSKGKVYVSDGRGISGFWVLDLKQSELTLVQHPLLAGSTGIAVDEREYKFFVVPRLKASKADGTLGTKQETGLLVVFNKENKVAQEMTFPGRPIGIALSGDHLFVTDGINHRIVVIDKKNLAITKTFGKSGEGESEFRFPKGIYIDEKGFVYVGDTFNGRIQVLDKNGAFVSQYGYYSSLLGGFLGLSGISTDKTGKIYAVDSLFRKKVAQDEIQIFDSAQFYRSGEKIPPADTKLTDKSRKNALYGYFQKPYAMEMGVAKNDFGESLYMPIGLAIDYQNMAYFEKYASPGTKIDYLIWLTSQSASNGKNITVFGHIAKK